MLKKIRINRMFYFFSTLFMINCANGQENATGTQNNIADQIKKERDQQLKTLNEQLKSNEEAIERLKQDLTLINSTNVQGRIQKLEEFNDIQEKRLRLLENNRKTSINLNGQLAFTELLSLQKDIKPADLFLASKTFYSELGNISNLQKYSDFTDWKTAYDEWYDKKKGKNGMLEMMNNSINLITNISSKIPLYGAVVQTVSSGISPLFSSIGGVSRQLENATPGMLTVVNTISQFESQKGIIDHEWGVINDELEVLEKENTLLIQDQLNYYGIDQGDYEKFLKTTLDRNRDNFKNSCRQIITAKMNELDSAPKTKGTWMRQVETYMYKVQSIRLRFGQLTMRMKTNIKRYDNLITVFSNDAYFPKSVSNKVKSLGQSLGYISDKFQDYFNPSKYIEDSAVMYIQ